MDEQLRDKLRGVGLDPDSFGEPGRAWQMLHQEFGTRATLLDRYALESVARGVAVSELDDDERARLTLEVTQTHWTDFEIVGGSDRNVADPIEVVDYDPDWPAQFDAWRRRLLPLLGSEVSRIEHVGSTSVPGLPAKPIIDVQVSMSDVDDESTYVPAIEQLGVALRSRDSDHRYFRPAGNRKRDVQIHVCQAGSMWERNHLLFRDYLRSHPDAARGYAQMKLESAARYRDDRIAYNESKTDFILDALDDAKRWAARTGWRVE